MLTLSTRKSKRTIVQGSPTKSPRRLTLSPMQLTPKKRQQKTKPQCPLAFSQVSLSSTKKFVALRARKLSITSANTSLHKAICEELNTSIPDQLLCRKHQCDDISEFITSAIAESHGGSLYISGAPGTGKTVCLQKVLDDLRLMGQDVCKVWVNCMSLKSTSAIYSHLVSELCGKKVKMNEHEAIKTLEKKLTKGSKMVLVVLDEIDQLDSKNQDILYRLFEWPMLQNSRLVLIGIANALDLTDRLLPRLTARISVRPVLLHFPPYSKQELIAIISERLNKVEGSNAIISAASVHLLSGKVASVSGDVRKALAVCRRAVEVTERKVRRQLLIDLDENIDISSSPKKLTTGKVDPVTIMQVFSEVYENAVVQQSKEAADSFPIHQKLAVCSLLLMLKTGKSKDASMGKLHETYRQVCKDHHVAAVNQSEFSSIMDMVQARGIITIKNNKEARLSRLSLLLDESELVQAMQDKVLLASILKNESYVKG